MNNESVWAANAAKVFIETHPRYIASQQNSEILTAEIMRLVDAGADPSDVSTYNAAFSNVWEQLKLREEEQRKTPEELTMAEIAALLPADQDKLSSAVLRRFANWEFQQRKQRPALSEADAILTRLFQESGFAFSARNARAIKTWMDAKGLGYSEANLQLAIDANENSLEPSETAISQMSSAEYKKRIVDPQFREWQAKQPKSEPSGVPFGVRATRFLHER